MSERAKAGLGAALRAFGILAIYLLVPSVFLLFAMTAALPAGGGELPPVARELFLSAGSVAALALIAGRFRKKGAPLREAAGFAPADMDRRDAALLFAAGLGCGLALTALLNLLPLPPQWLEAYDVASASAFDGEGRIVAAALAVLFAPFCEELVFRGFLLRARMRGISPLTSVVAISLVFGLMHGHPLWIAYAFLCGLLLGWLALLFDNLAAPMLLHAGINVPMLPSVFLRENEQYARVASNPIVLLLLLALGGGAAVCVLAGQARRAGQARQREREAEPDRERGERERAAEPGSRQGREADSGKPGEHGEQES
jgi:membrane protease YdiL (CAAX protease family)